VTATCTKTQQMFTYYGLLKQGIICTSIAISSRLPSSEESCTSHCSVLTRYVSEYDAPI